eukprot:TRINITY_DN24972_c0_g1_i1.p1 TRINITY_DN24972_c0_g1~~TRINITY_DN24972_c0_g1_i1.p1  ORF type:complete len:1926 (-),score=365.63 TRINITY_DN24972_c0_g1_i1:168-5105(-)
MAPSPEESNPTLAAKGFPDNPAGAAEVRGGFLLGDGTGCGKGRTIAALIQHVACAAATSSNQAGGGGSAPSQSSRRLRRCLWVSVSRDLYEDAQRDLTDTGATSAGLSLCQPGEAGEATASVMFVTYARLRVANHVRKIVDWLGGRQADGLIVFDEAHRAKNVVVGRDGGGGSIQGRMVGHLQRSCPGAAVLYSSATACTDVSQMAYMFRLGLWGPGRLFRDFPSFRSAVDTWGLAGMEAVALQLKAMGLASCRALALDGARFSVSTVPAHGQRVDTYNRACTFWARLLKVAKASLDWIDGEEPQQASSIKSFWSAFWACQSRFFLQLVVSLKVPEVCRRVEAVLADEGQAVLALWGTGEAQLKAAVEAKGTISAAGSDEEGEEVDTSTPSCPATLLEQFLERHFPDGRRSWLLSTSDVVRTMGPMPPKDEVDPSDLDPEKVYAMEERARGNWDLDADVPIALVALRRIEDDTEASGGLWAADFVDARIYEELAELREELADLSLPPHPLDELLEALGGPKKVAELSGRSHRLGRDRKGNWKLEPRDGFQFPAGQKNLKEQAAFQTGSKRVAIITEAASTGISLHSDKRRQKIGVLPRPRTLIVVELGWSAEQTLQQLGRVHRSNQRVPPSFELLIAPGAAAEFRVASALSWRLRTLGAVTRGDRNENLGEALSSVFDVDPGRAEIALQRLMDELRSDVKDDKTKKLARAVGSIGLDAELEANSVPLRRFLSRLLMLPIETQKAIFERLQELMHAERVATEGEHVAEGARACGGATFAQRAEILDEEALVLDPATPPLRLLRLRLPEEDGGRIQHLLAGTLLTALAVAPKLFSGLRALSRYTVAAAQDCGNSANAASPLIGLAVDGATCAGLRVAAVAAARGNGFVGEPSPLLEPTKTQSANGVGVGGGGRSALKRRNRGGDIGNSNDISFVEASSAVEGVAVDATKVQRVGTLAAPQDTKPSSPVKQNPCQGNPPVDKSLCFARVWGGGVGGQCRRKPAPRNDFCKFHSTEASKAANGLPSHGRIDGPIPSQKLKAFESCARKLEDQRLEGEMAKRGLAGDSAQVSRHNLSPPQSQHSAKKLVGAELSPTVASTNSAGNIRRSPPLIPSSKEPRVTDAPGIHPEAFWADVEACWESTQRCHEVAKEHLAPGPLQRARREMSYLLFASPPSCSAGIATTSSPMASPVGAGSSSPEKCVASTAAGMTAPAPPAEQTRFAQPSSFSAATESSNSSSSSSSRMVNSVVVTEPPTKQARTGQQYSVHSAKSSPISAPAVVASSSSSSMSVSAGAAASSTPSAERARAEQPSSASGQAAPSGPHVAATVASFSTAEVASRPAKLARIDQPSSASAATPLPCFSSTDGEDLAAFEAIGARTCFAASSLAVVPSAKRFCSDQPSSTTTPSVSCARAEPVDRTPMEMATAAARTSAPAAVSPTVGSVGTPPCPVGKAVSAHTKLATSGETTETEGSCEGALGVPAATPLHEDLHVVQLVPPPPFIKSAPCATAPSPRMVSQQGLHDSKGKKAEDTGEATFPGLPLSSRTLRSATRKAKESQSPVLQPRPSPIGTPPGSKEATVTTSPLAKPDALLAASAVATAPTKTAASLELAAEPAHHHSVRSRPRVATASPLGREVKRSVPCYAHVPFLD